MVHHDENDKFRIMTLEKFFHDPNFLSGLCGLGAFGVVLLIWLALIENDPLPARLKSILDRRDELRAKDNNRRVARTSNITRLGVVKKIVQKLKLEQDKKLDQIRLNLARAGYRSRDALFVYLIMRVIFPPGMAFLGILMIFVLHMFNLQPAMGVLVVIFCGILGVWLPRIFIKNQSQKREKILSRSMPDALDLLVICAEAGLSLDAGLDRVSREIGNSCPELAVEIGLTAIELNFLPDRPKALQNLADRVPLPGVIALTNTLIQTEKYGTPLAQALRVLSSEMREERIMAAETKAAKLPATLTVPMILFILPPLFVVLLGPAILRVITIKNGGH